MSVSMVAVAWRRLSHAARWNGQAPHVTTGAARVSDNHCHASNCRAGTIASRITGTARAAAVMRRVRNASVSSSGAGSEPVSAGAGGWGRRAVSPAAPTCAIRPSGEHPSGKATLARSADSFTGDAPPATLFLPLTILAPPDDHVI